MTDITKKFELNPNESNNFVRLSYNDLEGDTISIEDDEDLQLFFNTYNNTEKFVHIISKANDVGSAQTSSGQSPDDPSFAH
jgi:hypothetical protein